MKGKSMTSGAPWKHILRFAFPVLLGSLLQQLYNTVDTIIVGNFSSEEALSAVGTTGSLTFLFLALAMGFSAGNGVLIAQYYGAGHSTYPTFVAVCALSVGVAVVYIFRYSAFLGHTIIWWNGLFGFGVGFLITWGYFISGKWKQGIYEKE